MNRCLKPRRVYCRVRQEFSFRGDITDYDVNPQRNAANMGKSCTTNLAELSIVAHSYVRASVHSWFIQPCTFVDTTVALSSIVQIHYIYMFM